MVKTNTKLVGIYAPLAQSGKSTVAEWLIENCDFEELRFAQPLRDMWYSLMEEYSDIALGLESVEKLKETKLLFGTMSYRDFAEHVGTTAVRDKIDPNFWVSCFDQAYERLLDDYDDLAGIVVPDVRFPNEFEYLKANGATMIYVRRLNHPRGRDMQYPSEGKLDIGSFGIKIDAESLDELIAQLPDKLAQFNLTTSEAPK